MKLRSILKNQLFIEIMFYVLTFLLTFISYFVFKANNINFRNRDGAAAKTFVLSLFIVTCTIFYILKRKNKLNHNTIVLFILIIGFYIRLVYVLSTKLDQGQYDTFSNNRNGHAYYAYTIFSTGKLPTHNQYQFYHPPLNASIQALFMNITKLVLYPHGFDSDNLDQIHLLYQTCQILGVLYTTIISIYSYKILKALKLEGKGLLVAFIFASLFPRFIQLSGQLNNDLLCIMLCYLAIYYSIKWYQKHSFYNTIMLALSIGLAMNTKISGATICVTPAILFIMKLVNVKKSNDKKELGILISKYFIFFMICAPIGLWFQVYAKIRFDQPFGFVFSALNDGLSTAQYSIFDRFFSIINFDEMFYDVYASSWNNYSLFNYLVKSAIFGEFSFWQGEGFAFFAVFFNYLFVFSFIALLIVYLIKTKRFNKYNKMISLSIIITQLASIIYFYIKMPYGCTMDFRYVVPLVIAMAIILGDMYTYFKEIKKTKLLNFVVYCALSFIIMANICYYFVI